MFQEMPTKQRGNLELSLGTCKRRLEFHFIQPASQRVARSTLPLANSRSGLRGLTTAAPDRPDQPKGEIYRVPVDPRRFALRVGSPERHVPFQRVVPLDTYTVISK